MLIPRTTKVISISFPLYLLFFWNFRVSKKIGLGQDQVILGISPKLWSRIYAE